MVSHSWPALTTLYHNCLLRVYSPTHAVPHFLNAEISPPSLHLTCAHPIPSHPIPLPALPLRTRTRTAGTAQHSSAEAVGPSTLAFPPGPPRCGAEKYILTRAGTHSKSPCNARHLLAQRHGCKAGTGCALSGGGQGGVWCGVVWCGGIVGGQWTVDSGQGDGGKCVRR